MSKPVIKIRDLSKLYRVGELGTGTLSHDINRWWKTRVLGKEDPYSKIGSINNREIAAQKGEHIWALKDINLDVLEGDVLGIIGKNGAGKSTLLKILSRVTSPTIGSVEITGRLASLLEVGTGFHPELTGRENIYMNGTIMGMRKWEVTKQLDEIVDFAGVAKYLDTPVKRYSSGMTVRLGFAVAAHLEPEILIVDEVLAVGDAEFQKKALGKMQNVSEQKGRTILFVSHNMNSVRSICSKCTLIENGAILDIGETNEVVEKYESGYIERGKSTWTNSEINATSELKEIRTTDSDGNLKYEFSNSEDIHLEFLIHNYENISGVKIGFDLIKDGKVVFRSQQIDDKVEDSLMAQTNYKTICTIPRGLLNAGSYYLRPLYSIHGIESIIKTFDIVLSFRVNIDGTHSHYHQILDEHNHPGTIFPILKWELQKLYTEKS